MAKNLAQYIDIVEQAVGGRLDERYTPIQIVNDAGEYLVSMHNWSFLDRPPADLSFVAAQEYIDTISGTNPLPSDVREIVHIDVPNALETTVEMTTLKQVLYFRGSALDDPFRFYVALVYSPQANDASTQQPRLELWPTPGTAIPIALKLVYRAGWTVINEDDDFLEVPNIPLGLEPLLVALLQVYSRGVVDKKKELHRYLSEFEASAIVLNYKQRFGAVQGNLGRAEGGHIPYDQAAVYRPHRTITRS